MNEPILNNGNYPVGVTENDISGPKLRMSDEMRILMESVRDDPGCDCVDNLEPDKDKRGEQ